MSPARVRGLVLLVIVVGVALRLPSIDAGLGMDDFAQRAMLEGRYPVARPWWDLFAFSHGDPAEVARLRSAGALPWWSHPELKIAPLRPLASALVWFDVRVLGDRAPWTHVHSLAWLAAMLAMAAVVLRRSLPVREAIVALALLSLDDSHAYPTAWLANRSILVAGTFAFAAVGAHVWWRRDGARAGAWLAPVALAVALAAGEYGLAAVAYVIAYELTGRAGPWRARLRALLPMVGVTVAWSIAYHRLAAGAHGSAVYLDPWSEPGAALSAAWSRLGALAGNLVLALPTGELSLSAQGRSTQAWIGLVALVAFGVWANRSRGTTIDHPRWWFWGAMLTLGPSLGAFPAARLTLLAELGAAALLARLVGRAYDEVRHGRGAARLAWGVVGLAIAAAHAIASPWWGQRDQSAVASVHTAARVATDTLPLAPAEGPGLRMVVIAAADPMTLLYPPQIRAHEGQPPPDAWWVLSTAASRHVIVRRSAESFELRPESRAIGSGVIAQLFHRPPLAFAPGDRVDLSGMIVEVLETDAQGQVLAARFSFDRPLEDPSLRFVISTPDGYRRYPMGPVGVPVTIAPQPPAGLE